MTELNDEFRKYGLAVPQVLLPEGIDLSKWAVIACDQFTSQSEYWDMVRSRVFDVPSTLHIIHPEAWLSQGDARISLISAAMRDYRQNVLTRTVNGMILVERTLGDDSSGGKRLGLIAAVDLEAYDFEEDSHALIHATEGTVIERIPPRVDIRREAPLETTHVMLLADDPNHTLIEPVYADRENFELLYDVELMLGGGHVRGWKIDRPERLLSALEGLYAGADGLLFAVGDGNHSLASARKYWLELRETLCEEERKNHPARFALAEIVNLHDDALRFEPIHRVMFNTQISRLSRDLSAWLHERGMQLTLCNEERAMLRFTTGFVTRHYRIENCSHPLPLAVLQDFLDQWLKAHREASIDYIHGEEAARTLAQRQRTVGILLNAMDKYTLFDEIRTGGALPRKAFSMGEATDKRYYMECRSIRP